MIAQGQQIAQVGALLKKSLPDPEDLEIIVAHMEDAVRIAKKMASQDTEVVIARGTTADLLRHSGLPIPVVEMPISNVEIIESIKKAREASGMDDPLIGFLGFKNVIVSVKSFLEIMNIKMKLYEIHTTKDTQEQIFQAKRDRVDVLIGGVLSCNMIRAAGMKAVTLESSYESVAESYRQAKEMQRAVTIEKKKLEETNTIFNLVSDAILSIDENYRLTLMNQYAEIIFGREFKIMKGRPIHEIFGQKEENMIRKVMETGEEIMGSLVELQGRKYAIRIVPIVLAKRTAGAVVTLHEVNALQKMEAMVRKGLYQKGNVTQYTFEDIKGGSEEIYSAIDTAKNFARLQSNILIIGETGTGKELFAQSIHNASARRNGPFVAVNCGAIPANLMESELFGYVDGAFTGAKKGGKMGLFELAHSGTIFLDEISEMDMQGQVILLRALQEKQIRRVGGDSNIPIDVRIIAACNANLYERVKQNKFRKDLYYRLSVLVIKIPPLRERHGDITRLSNYFVEQYNRQFGKDITLSAAALRELENFGWDGNIRQLKNFCERITAISDDSNIEGSFIRQQLKNSFEFGPPEPEREPEPSGAGPARREMVVIKGKLFTKAEFDELFEQYHGNREQIAGSLGISRTTLWKYLKRAGLDGDPSQ